MKMRRRRRTPAEVQVMAEDTEPELPLHGDILQLILSRLPLFYLLPALRVSRSWSHAARSSVRHLNPPKPWLLLHSKSPRATRSPTTSAYDHSSRIWLRLQLPTSADHVISTTGILRSSGNMLYTISPSKLSFSLDPLHLTWHHVYGPLVWRADPIVALVGRRVIVAGGACDFEDDPMAVETYDLADGTWSSCDSMPSVLRDCPASTWLSVAAVGDMMYVMEKATGSLHGYNAQHMTWEGPIDLGITREASWWVMGAMRGGLVVAGVVGGKGGSPKGVAVWEVELGTWRVSKVGEMPAEMAGKFSGGRRMGVCCSDQGFTYLYSGGGGSLGVAWCEVVGKGVCRWGWVEGGGLAGGGEGETGPVLTCWDVGLEELDRAVTGQGLMLVEEA